MIDLDFLSAHIAAHRRVARIVIADHSGSTPRETGASMIVTRNGTHGTIGGGRLELRAVRRAVEMLGAGAGKHTEVCRQALGPALGQCCGGSVTLVTEIWDAGRLEASIDASDIEIHGAFGRRVEGHGPMPARIQKLQAGRSGRGPVPTLLCDGWLIEPVRRDRQPVFIYGAGHVGMALARVLAPLPQFEVVVADPRDALFVLVPETVICRCDAPAHAVMETAPSAAAHCIMTPEHEYDLELCHRLLARRFAYAGLIGSATKWARFRKRLQALGHSAAAIDQIECPIGDPSLGKQPHAIAVGIAARLLTLAGTGQAVKEDVA